MKDQRKQEREDTKIRNGVEGKFGEGKRFYGLGLVMTRLQETCESIHSDFCELIAADLCKYNVIAVYPVIG